MDEGYDDINGIVDASGKSEFFLHCKILKEADADVLLFDCNQTSC